MFLEPSNLDHSKVAIVDDCGARVTYGDLSELCSVVANKISERSLVLMFADRQIDTISHYYAFQSCNHVVMLLNPDSPDDVANKYIELYRPSYIWGKRSSKALNGVEVLSTPSHRLVQTSYQKAYLSDDLALLLTTSGSTGNPKTVRLSKSNLACNAEAFVDAISLREGDRGVISLPIFYTYGLAICHMHFFVGATLLSSEKKVYEVEFQEFISRERVSDLHGVPYIYECLDRSGFFDCPPASLRIMTMGGSKADPTLHAKLNRLTREKGIGFFAMYGQTEGTTILTKVPTGQDQNEQGCIGVPALGMSAFLDNETSELCFKGSSVCLGYAESWSDLGLGDTNRGLLRTGDTARIDDQGRIYLTGRLRRFIKIKGVRINLDDIEIYLEEHLGLHNICVGNDDSLSCCIVNCNHLNQVADQISNRFKISKRMIAVHSISGIPHNTQGKVDYSQLPRD